MIQRKKFRLCKNANKKISNVLKKRLPFFREFRIDDNPSFISQVDFFGNTDTLFSAGGERIYKNQNKSRNDNINNDICIECRSCRSRFISPDTNQELVLGGAYWYDTGKCWLAPRFGQIDTFTVYLPGREFVGHFCRYYLDIMFSKEETWEHMTGIHKEGNDSGTYIVFFNYRKFLEMYMKTVSDVTGFSGKLIWDTKGVK